VRAFPVEHLHFLFHPASSWSHSGRSMRKSPGQALIFLFSRLYAWSYWVHIILPYYCKKTNISSQYFSWKRTYWVMLSG